MRAAVIALVAVIIAACSGGSTDSASSVPTDVQRTPSSVPTSAPLSTTPTAPPADGAAAFDDAVDTFGAESPEATVAGFAAFTGPLPSSPGVGRTTELYPSFTNLFEQYADVAEQIDPADRAAIDERLDELFDADVTIELAEISDITDITDGAQPEGFRAASPPTTGRVLDDDDVDDTDRDGWTATLTTVWSDLNRLLPAPDTLDVVVLISTPSFWTLEGAGEGAEPGAGTVRREFIDVNPAFAPLRDRYGEHDCYIVVAADRDSSASSTMARAVLAHELFHCWHATRFGGDTADFYGVGAWVYEGIAAWVGETVAGGTSYPRDRWLPRYVTNDFDLFASEYEAYGFWARVDEFVDLWGLIPSLVDTSSRGTSAAVFDAAIGATGGNGHLVATGALQEASFGPAWVTGPWMQASTKRTPATHSATADSPPVELDVGAGQQAAHRVSVDAPADSFVDIAITGNSSGTWGDGSILAAGTDAVDVRYCVGECVCLGDPPPPIDGELPVGASELTIALSGTGGARATARVVVVERGDCAEESATSGDGALLGTWRADPRSVAAAFEAASGLDTDTTFGDVEPLDIAGSIGQVLMTFNENGTGTLVYDNVALFINDAVLRDIVLNGQGSFSWSSSGVPITITGTTYEFSVTSAALGGEPLTISSDDIPASGTTELGVMVDGNLLIVSSAEGSVGEVFFPAAWNRL